ncbi:MAG: Pyridoxine 5'-phosphate synthase (EC [uncultured Campylobacterales bacterium]|uniref:Pyridoxine 5'-phosphate synthase n=1 Tax=uncultured Campylobacterales bacterium TaxID=352960 RepID=A0A6S6SV63_9BACT|nr:MAG: Pyridoxine 5'-phosphate synthase (EC [uncultured Campylobacterales bacterium]
MSIKLGVNIDHIAVLREARQINDPSIIDALSPVKLAGADQITIHLREDRRHINEEDVANIIQNSPLPVNLECALNEEILGIVYDLHPNKVTFVPENRKEVTTEGGLDLSKSEFYLRLDTAIMAMKEKDIEVSLFIDPTVEAVRGAKGLNVDWIELHTGHFANLYAMLNTNLKRTKHSIKELNTQRTLLEKQLKKSLTDIQNATNEAKDFGLKVAAGHGLNYQNVKEILKTEGISELDIGQSIIARSVFTGLERAVRDMINLINAK